MELAAHEIPAAEVRLGDVMQHRTVSLSGGLGRVADAVVLDTALVDGEVEVVLTDHYAYTYQPDQVVVVYRTI